MIFKATESNQFEEVKLLEGSNYGDKNYELFMNFNFFITKLPYSIRSKYITPGSAPVAYFAYSPDPKALTLVNLKNFKSNTIDRFWRWDSRFKKKKVVPISTYLILKESVQKKKGKKKLKQNLDIVLGLCSISTKFFCITKLNFVKKGVEQSWYCYNDYFPNGKKKIFF